MSKWSDAEFWAEVLDLLTLGGPDSGDYSLADYVTGEAERRDPELARLRRERLAIFTRAHARAGDDDPLALDSPAELTAAEDDAHRALVREYNSRLRLTAANPHHT